MRRILTYGTFDLLHYGHIRLLKRAKQLGDYLVVALSTDEFNAIKNKKAYHNYETRKKMLEAIRYVDLVIPEENWEQKINDVQKYYIDAVVMGSDWKGSEKFEVLDGSEIDFSKAVYHDKYNLQRQELLSKGEVSLVGNKYILNVTLEFKSPSGASDFILGGSTNGWVEWKTTELKNTEIVTI